MKKGNNTDKCFWCDKVFNEGDKMFVDENLILVNSDYIFCSKECMESLIHSK